MLSAAHILAMDAKNLLDVVDSVRIRYPDLFVSNHSTSPTTSTSNDTSEPFQSMKNINRSYLEKGDTNVPTGKRMTPSTNVETHQMNVQQTYQNLSKPLKQPQTVATQEEIYANQKRVEAFIRTEGIYDNDCVLSQLKNHSNEENKLNSTVVGPSNIVTSLPPTKPPLTTKPGKRLTANKFQNPISKTFKILTFSISVKSSNLQEKIKALNNAGLSVSAMEKLIPTSTSLGEPLKIIEDDKDIYSNTKPEE